MTPSYHLETFNADVSTAVAAMKTGAIEFPEKPCERATLLDRVEKALALDREWRQRGAEFAALAERIDRLNARNSRVRPGLAILAERPRLAGGTEHLKVSSGSMARQGFGMTAAYEFVTALKLSQRSRVSIIAQMRLRVAACGCDLRFPSSVRRRNAAVTTRKSSGATHVN